MAAAMAKISELEAANAGLEASAKKKDAALGNISAMSLEAQGLPNGGAVGPAAASPLVGQSGHKRSHYGNGIANAKGKKQKRKEISKHAGSNSGGKSKTGKPFRPNGEKEWLIEKRLCLHCCKPSHQSFDCSKKKAGEPAAPMPAEFAKSAKA
ncbi:TPA: hypothetical protein ACH3X1_006834 [Trebouxia sp. C0004]